MNVTTAIAWLCFFHGLKQLEPAVVATLYNGIRPIAVLMTQARGWSANRTRPHPSGSLKKVG